MLSDTDIKLINKVAKIWVDGGGDDMGLDFCYSHLKRTIAEIWKEREEKEKWEHEKSHVK